MRVAVLIGVALILYAPNTLAGGATSQPAALETFAWLLAPLLFVTFTIGFLVVLLGALCSGDGR